MLCACEGVYVHMCTGAHRYHQRALDPLELKSQMVWSHTTWVLGTELQPVQEQHVSSTVIPAASNPTPPLGDRTQALPVFSRLFTKVFPLFLIFEGDIVKCLAYDE